MIGFGIDEIQAEYVAEIKLRHLNREYILKRTDETQSLKEEIAQMEEILERPEKGAGHYCFRAAGRLRKNMPSRGAV